MYMSSALMAEITRAKTMSRTLEYLGSGAMAPFIQIAGKSIAPKPKSKRPTIGPIANFQLSVTASRIGLSVRLKKRKH